MHFRESNSAGNRYHRKLAQAYKTVQITLVTFVNNGSHCDVENSTNSESYYTYFVFKHAVI